jgi:hypothetical protein
MKGGILIQVWATMESDDKAAIEEVVSEISLEIEMHMALKDQPGLTDVTVHPCPIIYDPPQD